jgi:hypothetical protein
VAAAARGPRRSIVFEQPSGFGVHERSKRRGLLEVGRVLLPCSSAPCEPRAMLVTFGLSVAPPFSATSACSSFLSLHGLTGGGTWGRCSPVCGGGHMLAGVFWCATLQLACQTTNSHAHLEPVPCGQVPPCNMHLFNKPAPCLAAELSNMPAACRMAN